MRKIARITLLAALCVLLASCGAKAETPDPAPQSEPQAPAQTEPVEPDVLEPVPPETESIADGFTGTWRNDSPGSLSNGRCRMEIDCEDGVNYGIYIRWGCSSATSRYWVYTGTYDEAQGGIAYTGYSFYGETQFDGSIKKSEERENLEGLIRLEDGVLYWEDTVDHAGEEMGFNRIE